MTCFTASTPALSGTAGKAGPGGGSRGWSRPLSPADRCPMSRARPSHPRIQRLQPPLGPPSFFLFFSACVWGPLRLSPMGGSPFLTQAVPGSALAHPPPGSPLCFMSWGGHVTLFLASGTLGGLGGLSSTAGHARLERGGHADGCQGQAGTHGASLSLFTCRPWMERTCPSLLQTLSSCGSGHTLP